MRGWPRARGAARTGSKTSTTASHIIRADRRTARPSRCLTRFAEQASAMRTWKGWRRSGTPSRVFPSCLPGADRLPWDSSCAWPGSSSTSADSGDPRSRPTRSGSIVWQTRGSQASSTSGRTRLEPAGDLGVARHARKLSKRRQSRTRRPGRPVRPGPGWSLVGQPTGVISHASTRLTSSSARARRYWLGLTHWVQGSATRSSGFSGPATRRVR
jgi:hypothetical protein